MLKELKRFYRLLGKLERRVGGKKFLRDCHRRMNWPDRGVYFFFEDGEERQGSGNGLRVVRVGTVALNEGGRGTLWRRLRQHRSGNPGQSVFCSRVRNSMQRRDGVMPAIDQVGEYISDMPFLWVAVNDEAGPNSRRAFIERNAIALLTTCDALKADPPSGARQMCGSIKRNPPSGAWLGLHNDSGLITRSGLWNRDHVFEHPDLAFLKVLEKHIERTHPLE